VRIFISYSHNNADQPLARYLALRLRAVGIDVWQDESSQPAGEQLQEDIEKAIRESDHAIFIVSKIWLESRWCKVEVDRFDKRRTKVRRIPIFRLAPERLRLPAPLIDLKGITWLPGEPHRDARFWEVICALQGREPGPADQWAAEGAKLTHDAGDFDDTVTAAPKDFGSLQCDRGPQWADVRDAEPDDSHDVLIVPGAAGQAHDHFSRRIRETLTAPPTREIISVTWRQRPASKAEFLAALARSLDVLPSSLEREMAERMDDTNLIVLHPCLRSTFVDGALISYYTEWLPELLSVVKPTRSLKCVQPVEWPVEESAVGTVLTWLRFKPSSQEGKSEAETFITRVQHEVPAAMRCMRLRDLAEITDEDVDEFCQKERLTGTKKTFLIASIKARKPRNSEEKLAAIEAFLPDARTK